MTNLRQVLVEAGERAVAQHKRNKGKPVSYTAIADDIINRTKAELFDAMAQDEDTIVKLVNKFGVI
jgi:hypothetical protein